MGRPILPHTFSVLCYGTAFTFTLLFINKKTISELINYGIFSFYI